MTSIRDNLINAIEKLGWHLTSESVDEFLKDNKNLKQIDLTKLALDSDLRSIGAKYLPDLSTGVKPDIIQGPCVLQLVKVRNIAAPKDNENSQTAPPFYRLTLTDGVINLNALLIDELNQKLNLNTPPGTKILLKDSVKIKSNLMMLNNTNCQILGGYVDYLVTKWKTNKELQQHIRVVNLATAPPPWVPFGVKQTNQVDTSKKVFAQADKQGEDETSEFSQARQAALAEAMEAKLKITKTFAPQTIDKSQIKSEPEPTPPPSALLTQATSAKQTKKQGKGRKGRNFDRDDEDDYKDAKDAVKPKAVTLFDMVKNHLDIEEPEDQHEPVSSQDYSHQQQQQQPQRGGRSGRGRGGRNQGMNRNSGFNNKQQQQQHQQPKQIYDKDDFSYDLGDTTKVKDLVKIPKMTNTSENKKQENKSQEIVQNDQASAQSYTQNNNYNKPRGNNNIFNDNNNRNNNNSNRQNENNFQYNQARNNNNNNNQQRSYQNNFQEQQPPIQPQQQDQRQFNQPNYNNNNNNNQRAYQQPPRQKFINWRIGDECLARHPNDGRMYPVLIQNINYTTNVCLVNFIGYNEYYEFYLNDLAPNTNQYNYNNQYNNNNNNNRNYNNNNNNNNNNENRQNRRY